MASEDRIFEILARFWRILIFNDFSELSGRSQLILQGGGNPWGEFPDRLPFSQPFLPQCRFFWHPNSASILSITISNIFVISDWFWHQIWCYFDTFSRFFIRLFPIQILVRFRIDFSCIFGYPEACFIL